MSDLERDAAVEQKFLSCGDCGKQSVKSRGLCGTCYQAARRGGYLDDYPLDQVYDRSWAENVLAQIVAVHGKDILDTLR